MENTTISGKTGRGSVLEKKRDDDAPPPLVRQDSLSDQHFEEVRQFGIVCQDAIPLPAVLQTLVLQYMYFDSFVWDDKWKGSMIKLAKGGRVAKSISSDSGSQWQTVTGTCVWDQGRHYFELSIDDVPDNASRPTQIAVGCVPDGPNDWVGNPYAIPGFTVPGWMLNLRSGVKAKFRVDVGKSKADKFYTDKEPLCTVGNRVGMCLDFDKKSIEYTCNGRSLGIAFDDLNVPVRVVAGLTRNGTQVSLHFPRIG